MAETIPSLSQEMAQPQLPAPSAMAVKIRAKQSQFPAAPGGARPGGRRPWRAIVQNKANLAPGVRKRTLAGRPGAPAGVDCAKRTQSCGVAYRAKQSQLRPGRNRARTPNPRRDECAKRSQTWAGWGIWGTEPEERGPGVSYKQTQFPGRAGWDEATGAWDEGQMCKTNPIPSGAGQPSRAPRPSGLAPGPEAVVQTKPIARSGAPRRCPAEQKEGQRLGGK